MRKSLFLAALAIALVAAACGSDADTADQTSAPASTAGDDHGTTGGHDEALFAFGEPANAADADRTVRIRIEGTEMRFDPSTVEVTAGETIAFEVSNDSSVEHDFTLGDEETQAEHAQQMASMASHGGMSDEANAVLLPPGASKTVAWRFTEPGTVIYGCHITGHYEAGMKGTVEVTP